MPTPPEMSIDLETIYRVTIGTDRGDIVMDLDPRLAPKTVNNFVSLARQGYYDGLTFHRILPGFVIQGGDPLGDGTGGPGYTIGDEFSDRQHLEGVLSMAHTGAPNSGGSQFFVCLDYNSTKHLDGGYAAFGKVVDGMDAVKKIAATPLSNPQAGTPVKAPVIQKAEVLPVTKDHNPYAGAK